jgi:5S rRNA maturation endonuclease (ribonuclease M5)
MINGIDRYHILKSKVNQEELFKSLGFEVEYDRLVYNPERPDKTPKCSFKWFNGFLMFRDFTNYFGPNTVNVFQVFEFIHKRSFSMKDLESNVSLKKIGNSENENSVRNRISIKFKNKPWPTKHYLFDIPSRILHQENIFLVDEYWCNTSRHKIMVMNRFNNPKQTTTIAYLFKGLRSRTKLYFVGNTLKFYTNTSNEDVFGLHNLVKKDDTLFITKSGADFLCLRYVLNYDAIALNSEWPNTTNRVLDEIKKYAYKQIIILYDNDNAGIKNSKALQEFMTENGFQNVVTRFIPEKVEKQDCKDCKDLYYINRLKLKKVLKLIRHGKFFKPSNY